MGRQNRSQLEPFLDAALEPLIATIEQLGERIGGVSTRISAEFLAPLNSLGTQGGRLVQSFIDPLRALNSQIQAPMAAVAGGMQQAALAAFAPLQAGLAVFGAATSDAFQQIRTMVGRANPAAVLMFDRALDDLSATLGQTLQPVLEGVTFFIRETADVFQGLRPALAPIMTGIQDIIVVLSKLLEPLAGLLAPVLQLIGGIISNVVVPAVKLLVEGLVQLVDAIKDILHVITLGILSFDAYRKGESMGASVRPASYGQGSAGILEIGRRTTLAALQSGRGASLSPDGKEITKRQDRTNELLKMLAEQKGGKEAMIAIDSYNRSSVGPLEAFINFITFSSND